MVKAVVFAGFFHGQHILGVLHHANNAFIPFRTCANGAHLRIRKVLANFTAMNGLLRLDNGLGKAFCLILRLRQNEKCQSYRGFMADAG